ncbi:MAG: hypothetical protein H6809_04530 [Phycisphaeraceae bacterium]|nr:hypothetical protein [Phycisphaeraceae bacterium]
MTHDSVRKALSELNGERDVSVGFVGVYPSPNGPASNVLEIKRAMLIPDEADHLVKVTDGTSIFILDAERIAWIRIGLKKVH